MIPPPTTSTSGLLRTSVAPGLSSRRSASESVANQTESSADIGQANGAGNIEGCRDSGRQPLGWECESFFRRDAPVLSFPVGQPRANVDAPRLPQQAATKKVPLFFVESGGVIAGHKRPDQVLLQP